MDAMALLIPLFIAVAIGIRLAAGSMDHDRIRQYVQRRGGKFLSAEWSPFGPGWFGEKNDRIYVVRYLDKDRNEHEAHCKTSLWSGVYFTKDRILKYAEQPNFPAPPAEDAEDSEDCLVTENRRLREELERLRRQSGRAESDPDRM